MLLVSSIPGLPYSCGSYRVKCFQFWAGERVFVALEEVGFAQLGEIEAGAVRGICFAKLTLLQAYALVEAMRAAKGAVHEKVGVSELLVVPGISHRAEDGHGGALAQIIALVPYMDGIEHIRGLIITGEPIWTRIIAATRTIGLNI